MEISTTLVVFSCLSKVHVVFELKITVKNYAVETNTNMWKAYVCFCKTRKCEKTSCTGGNKRYKLLFSVEVNVTVCFKKISWLQTACKANIHKCVVFLLCRISHVRSVDWCLNILVIMSNINTAVVVTCQLH